MPKSIETQMMHRRAARHRGRALACRRARPAFLAIFDIARMLDEDIMTSKIAQMTWKP